ncbi:MAG: DEAD/DEAH box helicase, partial [Nanoarchaeota archaeon]
MAEATTAAAATAATDAIVRKETPDTAEEILNILHPIVKQWFFSQFKEFSLPQLFGVMEIHSRNNILVSAPTGATKTLTAFLSILNELVDSSEKGILEEKIYCVYISPLKALNNDISKNLKEPLAEMERLAGRKLGIRIGVRTGDTEPAEKVKMLKKPPHVLITTPESLGIVLSSSKFVEHLKNVDWCIVDEIHALAENKRGVHLSLSLERLQRLSHAMARIGLSATIAPLDEIAKFLVGISDVGSGQYRSCKICDVQFVKKMDLKVLSPVPDLIDVSHSSMSDQMYSLIDSLIQQHRTTLIFTNTRSATERVINHLKEKFPKKYAAAEQSIGAHHGSLSKSHRYGIESALRSGKLKCVVSSTSLELGIDIGYIDLVILLG